MILHDFQISEYVNALRETQQQQENHNKYTKKKIPISHYFKRTAEKENADDVQIIDSDLKGMEKRLGMKNARRKTKKEVEEEKRMEQLNVKIVLKISKVEAILG